MDSVAELTELIVAELILMCFMCDTLNTINFHLQCDFCPSDRYVSIYDGQEIVLLICRRKRRAVWRIALDLGE